MKSFVGIYLSYYFDIASGASVVMLSTLVFGCVLLWTRIQRRQKVASCGRVSTGRHCQVNSI